METTINGFLSVSEAELLYIDGGRDVAGLVIGTAGLAGVGLAIVLAAIYCPAAIPAARGAIVGTVITCTGIIAASL